MSGRTSRGPGRAVAALRTRVDGGIHLPGDPRYDELRLPWNRAIDPRPSIILEAVDTRDVQAAVAVAREHGMPIAPQATGHGTVVPCDGGLLLHTSRLSSVTVDPQRRTARVGPGARLADVIDAAARLGLAPVAGNRSVGVAGFVLGGGIGWLSRRFGLAADWLLRATVVTADGSERLAGPHDHPDLLWALRGGGGSLGVVTSMEFTLHQITHGYGGWVAYGVEQAPALLRRYRQWARDAPDDVNVGVLLTWPSPRERAETVRSRPVIVVRALCLSPPHQARRQLRPLLAEAGRPLAGGFDRVPVTEMGRGASPPAARMQHTDLFQDLADDVIDAIVDCVDTLDGSAVRPEVEIRHWGGAIGRPPPGAGPAGPSRTCRFSITVQAVVGGAASRAQVSRHLDLLACRLAPFATGGSFLNFLTDPAQVAAAFTPADHARLRAVKHRYDPDNFFRLNRNVPPAPPDDRSGAPHDINHPAGDHPHR